MSWSEPPIVRLSTAPPAQITADLLVVPVFEDDDLADLAPLDEATGGDIARALRTRECTGKPFDLLPLAILREGWQTRRLTLVGAGTRATCNLDRVRKLASTAGLTARKRQLPHLAFLHRSGLGGVDSLQAIAEGSVIAAFDTGFYKTKERELGPLEAATIVAGGNLGDGVQAVNRGTVLGTASNLARSFANEPSNVLTPTIFAARAAERASEVGLAVQVLDEREIAALNMGLLLGVSRGSAEPPRVIVIRHDPPGAPDTPVLGLVGKGVTFDTGGISIKPADGMERMKDDMAGGAAVVAAMRAIALLKAPIRVVGVVPATENMPGGRAIKPGDVLTSASGKTVEVVNTDAEGRLILGDALWYAQRAGATHLVDVATLTGACVVALGRTTSGLFGTPEPWMQLVRRTAERAGDRAWPMPLFDDYRELLRSEIADMVNSAGRPAGSITAAMFLKEFTGGLPWAHLDVAGTAWTDEARPFHPKGPIGVGVRTLTELAFTYGQEGW
jgi:leucyl aminopeptidase